MIPRIQVAVGVIFNPQGQVLVASRLFQAQKCWEFPGGKLESGETVCAALKRELIEEIGIEIISHQPWFELDYDYDLKPVRLNIHKVFSFAGQPKGCMGQEIKWVTLEELRDLPMLPANDNIITSLIGL